MWVLLEFLYATIDGTPPIGIAQENARQSARQFCSHLPESHLALGARRERHGQAIAVKVVELLQRLDQQIVHWEPDGAAPVRVAAKQPGGGLRWLVIHTVFRTVDRQDVWVRAMQPGEGSNPVGRQKFSLIEHILQHTRELVACGNRE